MQSGSLSGLHIEHAGSGIAAERRAVVTRGCAFRPHRQAGRRAFDVITIAIQSLHQFLVRNHALWRACRIADDHDGDVFADILGGDLDPIRPRPVGAPDDAQEGDIGTGLGLYVEHLLDCEYPRFVGGEVVELVQGVERARDRPPTHPAAEDEIAAVPSRDQARDVAVRDHNVRIDHPACSDEIDVRELGDIDPSDKGHERLQSLPLSIEVTNEVFGLLANGGNVFDVEPVVLHE